MLFTRKSYKMGESVASYIHTESPFEVLFKHTEAKLANCQLAKKHHN